MDFGAATLTGSSKVKSDESSARPSGKILYSGLVVDLTSNWFDNFTPAQLNL